MYAGSLTISIVSALNAGHLLCRYWHHTPLIRLRYLKNLRYRPNDDQLSGGCPTAHQEPFSSHHSRRHFHSSNLVTAKSCTCDGTRCTTSQADTFLRYERSRQDIPESLRSPWGRSAKRAEIRRLVQNEGDNTERPRLGIFFKPQH